MRAEKNVICWDGGVRAYDTVQRFSKFRRDITRQRRGLVCTTVCSWVAYTLNRDSASQCDHSLPPPLPTHAHAQTLQRF